MSEKEENLKRYNLSLPQKDFDELKMLADERGTTMLALIRQSMTLGLILYYALQKGGVLIKRQNGKDTEVEIIW